MDVTDGGVDTMRESIEYSLALTGPLRYELVVIDRKRGKRWAIAGAFVEDAILSAGVNLREKWNDGAELELWAAIDVESPDTLVEAHTRGWVNAFKIHAYARQRAFAATQDGGAP